MLTYYPIHHPQATLIQDGACIGSSDRLSGKNEVRGGTDGTNRATTVGERTVQTVEESTVRLLTRAALNLSPPTFAASNRALRDSMIHEKALLSVAPSGRYRNWHRNRHLQLGKTDFDCDSDCDPDTDSDTDVFAIFPYFGADELDLPSPGGSTFRLGRIWTVEL